MKDMWHKIYNQFKNLFKITGGWFMWLAPLALLLIALFAPTYLFSVDFLKLVEIVVWPFTILTTLFFFKKVVTYLFFSMDEFNFFGLKGNLKNINEVIVEEVNKRIFEKEREDKRRDEMEKLNAEIVKKGGEIEKKQREITTTKTSAQEYINLAKEIFKEWKKSTEANNKAMSDLETENKRLKEIVSGLSPNTPEVSSVLQVDDSKTSDPIQEESKINS